MSAHTLCITTLSENTDVVAWCPGEDSTNLLAVGTYQLDEASGLRHGHAYIYSVDAAAEDAEGVLNVQSQTSCAGVFDMEWRPAGSSGETPVLALALSDGTLCLVDSGLHPLASSTASSESDALACCVDWRRGEGGAAPDGLLASFSDGAAERFQATPAGITSLARWTAHSLEAWAAACDPTSPSLSYTGGDDAALCAWDDREGPAPVWTNRREHGAGVCCIAPSPHTPHLVATGSYDEGARAWDLRWPGRPMLLGKHGFLVLRAGGGGVDWGVEERYAHQRTLAYGADWCRAASDGQGGPVVATASFYDNALHIWRPATVG